MRHHRLLAPVLNVVLWNVSPLSWTEQLILKVTSKACCAGLAGNGFVDCAVGTYCLKLKSHGNLPSSVSAEV
jgi:hypothetical protein